MPPAEVLAAIEEFYPWAAPGDYGALARGLLHYAKYNLALRLGESAWKWISNGC